MQLDTNKLLINKTFRFLFPIVKELSSKVYALLMDLKIIGIFHSDKISDSLDFNYTNHLFICFNLDNDKIIKSLQEIRTLSCYENDYHYEIIDEKLTHILVLKIPAEYNKTSIYFKKSLYSKMYERAKVMKLFNTNNVVIKASIGILLKTKESMDNHLEVLRKDFNVPELNFEDIKDHELEYPLNNEEEILNYNKNPKQQC